MFVTLEDILIAARTIYGEARGETDAGMRAVAHVLINRTDKKIGDADHSLAATALRARQFSAWNEDDPNRKKMQTVSVNNKLFRRCMGAMLAALGEPDTTSGARNYMTRARRAKGWPRSWGRVRKPVAEIGVHLFYNDVE